MTNIKDTSSNYAPREKFLDLGPAALSKSDLLAILIGSGIKGHNIQQLSKKIIRKFGNRFLNITADELLEIKGIGPAKALQILSAIALISRFYKESKLNHATLERGYIEFDLDVNEEQEDLFEPIEVTKNKHEIHAEKIKEIYFHIPRTQRNYFQLHNRRYIGNKHKLIGWIFSVINKECKGKSFTDIFAGTGVVSAFAGKHFGKVIVNDFLYSNQAIYKAFLGNGEWDERKIKAVIQGYNNVSSEDLEDNYFSINFGQKYFSRSSAKIIGSIRENIEENRNNLTNREYNILISSLLYSTDKIANTVGHYDAYFKKGTVEDKFFMRPIHPIKFKEIHIFREDANLLAKKIETDIVYIDPPYNSRQYSRFYHVLETLAKWDCPKLHGVALKPDPENMSDYCRVSAKNKFAELVDDINAKYLIVSYNNTYMPKSKSSKNKITLEEMERILSKIGKTKIFEKDYRHFNAGNTNFKSHKEYLFVTKR